MLNALICIVVSLTEPRFLFLDSKEVIPGIGLYPWLSPPTVYVWSYPFRIVSPIEVPPNKTLFFANSFPVETVIPFVANKATLVASKLTDDVNFIQGLLPFKYLWYGALLVAPNTLCLLRTWSCIFLLKPSPIIFPIIKNLFYWIHRKLLMDYLEYGFEYLQELLMNFEVKQVMFLHLRFQY